MKASTRIAAASLIVAATATAALAQSRPPAQITVHNLRTVPLALSEIATPDEPPRLVGKLAKPLAPGARATIRLNKPQGCAYAVMGRFDDEAESDAQMDLCKDKVIRLTE